MLEVKTNYSVALGSLSICAQAHHYMSERSETVLGVDNAKSGTCSMYVYIIYIYVWIVRMPLKRARVYLFSPKNTVF